MENVSQVLGGIGLPQDNGIGSVPTLSTGYNASIGSDIASFSASLESAQQAQLIETDSGVANALIDPLGQINNRAADLAQYATDAMANGSELSPGEIVTLTVKSQEFMFHSQLTANVANRTADGLQQLFRQQG